LRSLWQAAEALRPIARWQELHWEVSPALPLAVWQSGLAEAQLQVPQSVHSEGRPLVLLPLNAITIAT
jgi:hypothetical protein